MPDTTIADRRRRSQWLAIIAIAVLVHLVLLVAIKPEFFSMFQKSIDDEAAGAREPSFRPDAIIAIPVDIEGEEPFPIEIETTSEPSPSRADGEAETRTDATDGELDLDDIVDSSPSLRPSSESSRSISIPPRPVEITWPETRNLRHCLGLQIDIRIRVSADGDILDVEPARADYPPDCTKAALDAAARIVFVPGKVAGKPATMWTQIRIDFRDQPR